MAKIDEILKYELSEIQGYLAVMFILLVGFMFSISINIKVLGIAAALGLAGVSLYLAAHADKLRTSIKMVK